VTTPGYKYALCLGNKVLPTVYLLLYHGTDEHPHSSTRVGGLPAKGTDLELLHHAEPPPGVAPNSAFRGATLFVLSLLRDAGAALWGQYVYEISAYPGYDVVTLLQGRIPCPGGFRGVLMQAEQEIAIPAEVPLARITRAGIVKPNLRGLPIIEWVSPWP